MYINASVETEAERFTRRICLLESESISVSPKKDASRHVDI